MNNLKNNALFSEIPDFLKLLFTKTDFPWQIIPLIKNYISEIIQRGLPGFTEVREGVLVAEGASIHDSAIVEGNSIIQRGATLRPGAYLRGNVIICEGCVVGNSTEVKNSIMLPEAKAPHYNYVGDSIIGYRAHLGAGVICSNLKADKSNVTIRYQSGIETGLGKLGAIVGDYAEIGCGAVLNPGSVIGKRTSVYPLTSVRGVYKSDMIVKSENIATKRST